MEVLALTSKNSRSSKRLRYALRTLYRRGYYYLEGYLFDIERVVSIITGFLRTKFLETVEGIRVLLLSVLDNTRGSSYR